MEKEFLLIIEKAAIQVSRTRDEEEGHMGRKARGYIKENMPKQLTKMLQICFERFRTVVSAHSTLLEHFKRAKRTYKGQCSVSCSGHIPIIISLVRNCLDPPCFTTSYTVNFRLVVHGLAFGNRYCGGLEYTTQSQAL